ncbi:MAG: HD domain-containing protein [Lachnospiraceae bacterium]|nr:HD domain-containing protein [Lachnospiraceae bacterium]MCR5767265.1 HD domain-containing protein [Lachnospiraceae bacterium]
MAEIFKIDEYAPLFNIEGAFEEDIQDAMVHGCYVANLAYRLAKKLGYDEEFCLKVMQAGMLHDIGKLRLEDGMYSRKEDLLKADEMKYVRMHPTLGYELLCEKKIGDNEIRQSVFHHHENFDGSGYPDNISGEDIPVGARILRVCDVYSALVSDRHYREAYDKDTAITFMIEEVKNFDMRIFLALMELLHSDEFYEMEQLGEMMKNQVEIQKEKSANSQPAVAGRLATRLA